MVEPLFYTQEAGRLWRSAGSNPARRTILKTSEVQA